MADGYPHIPPAPGPPVYEQVLNGGPARRLPERRPIPARARKVWENDGEEWVDGDALRLDSGVAILVQFADPKCKFTGVWLSPDDVGWEGKPD